MKQIPLKQKGTDVPAYVMVDDEDYEWLSKFKWFARVPANSKTMYALRNYQVDYDRNTQKSKFKTMRMHRMIVNCPPDMVVDHIDGNGLNNQKSNLRICTQFENMQNRAKVVSKYLGVRYEGVKRYKKKKRYVAYLTIGRFETELEAAIAYNNAAKIILGESAILNKIPD